MASQMSKAALKLLGKTEFLVTSIKNLKTTAGIQLGVIFHEILSTVEGEPPHEPDWNVVQDCNLVLLEASGAEVRRTDRAYRRDRVRDRQLRRDRRDHVGQLKEGHRDLRQSFSGTYGDQALPLVGLDAPLDRRFLAIREQMQEVVERMLDPELAGKLPDPRAGQAAIDLEALVGARQGELEELEVTMEAIKGMRKRLDASIVTRDEAQSRHRRVYANVARVQEGLYRLAGLDDLADRIRVTEPSPRQKQQEDGQKEPPGEQNNTQEEQNEQPVV